MSRSTEDPTRTRDLERYRGPMDDPPCPTEGFAAAVSLIVRNAERPGAGGDSEFLLVRRARSERDPWSGHMALPGGRRDDTDSSLLRTAVRETLEETDIDLDAAATLLGCLSPVEPLSPQLPAISILPFVFRLDRAVDARARPGEIAEILWAPLETLECPEARSIHHHRQDGMRIAFPAYEVGGHTVWGLTHRILTDFVRRRT